MISEPFSLLGERERLDSNEAACAIRDDQGRGVGSVRYHIVPNRPLILLALG